jgi:hypothetical protein
VKALRDSMLEAAQKQATRTLDDITDDALEAAQKAILRTSIPATGQAPERAAQPVKAAYVAARGSVRRGASGAVDVGLFPFKGKITQLVWEKTAYKDAKTKLGALGIVARVVGIPLTITSDLLLACFGIMLYAMATEGVTSLLSSLDWMGEADVENIDQVCTLAAVMKLGPEAIIKTGQYIKGLDYPELVLPSLAGATMKLSVPGAVVGGLKGIKSGWSNVESAAEAMGTSYSDIDRFMSMIGRVDIKPGQAATVNEALEKFGGSLENVGVALQASYDAYLKGPPSGVFEAPNVDTVVSDFNTNFSADKIASMFVPAGVGGLVGVQNPDPEQIAPAIPVEAPEEEDTRESKTLHERLIRRFIG